MIFSLTHASEKNLRSLSSRSVRRQKRVCSKGRMRLMATCRPVGRCLAATTVPDKTTLDGSEWQREPVRTIRPFPQTVENLVVVAWIEKRSGSVCDVMASLRTDVELWEGLGLLLLSEGDHGGVAESSEGCVMDGEVRAFVGGSAAAYLMTGRR